MSHTLSDPSAERAVLAGICKYSDKAYYDIADLLNDESFTLDSNKILFKCLKYIFDNEENTQIDIPSIFASANALGMGHFFQQPIEMDHLKAILQFPVLLENVRKFAKKIYKLAVIRTLIYQLQLTQQKMSDCTGDESLCNILSMAENTVFDLSSVIGGDENESYIKLGDKIDPYIAEVTANPVEQIGLSTGYSRYDTCIGGGLRIGLNVVAARPKIGKSTFSLNVANHAAIDLNIPVLYLDTEMVAYDQIPRWLGMTSNVSTSNIECGSFYENSEDLLAIEHVKAIAQNAPLFYRNIAGLSLEEQITIMRRFYRKEVGSQKKCLIIYDYFQLTDSKDLSSTLQEYQVLGFMMKALSVFASSNEIPILMMVQLNRDYDVSGSDRIKWICTNFSKLLKKTDDEISEDGVSNGNRKLIIDATRYGEGLEYGDYINFNFQGSITKMKELTTKFEIDPPNYAKPKNNTKLTF